MNYDFILRLEFFFFDFLFLALFKEVRFIGDVAFGFITFDDFFSGLVFLGWNGVGAGEVLGVVGGFGGEVVMFKF